MAGAELAVRRRVSVRRIAVCVDRITHPHELRFAIAEEMFDRMEPGFRVSGGCRGSRMQVDHGYLAFCGKETVHGVLDEFEVSWIEIVAIVRVAKNFEREIA